MAGGVPCPPFTIAGKQLGATDERDLFAWAIELCGTIRPRALLLENVRGLSLPRFAAYRQRVLDRLAELGYAADWRLLHASQYGVPQLRPRFVLVAMRPEDLAYFGWPEPQVDPGTVGETLAELMAANGWPGAERWARTANDIAPTIVGGSKKHGGADLGPTRAKRAWRELGVNALGIADAAPSADDPVAIAPTIVGGSKKHGGADLGPTRAKRAWRELGVNALGIADAAPGEDDPVTMAPKLTCAMVARLQGWDDAEYQWTFTGRKTSHYRQIGNAFPPPVARAIGGQIRRALDHEGAPGRLMEQGSATHDPVYAVLRDDGGFLTMDQVLRRLQIPMEIPAFERHLAHLRRDFRIEVDRRKTGDAYRLGEFRAFVGQDDHLRHEAFAHPAKIS